MAMMSILAVALGACILFAIFAIEWRASEILKAGKPQISTINQAETLIFVPCHNEILTLTKAIGRLSEYNRFGGTQILVALSYDTLDSSNKKAVQKLNDAVAIAQKAVPVTIYRCPTSCKNKAQKLGHILNKELRAFECDWLLVVDVDSNIVTPAALYTLRPTANAEVAQATIVTLVSPRSGLLCKAVTIAQMTRTNLENYALHRWSTHQRPFMMGLMGAAMVLNRAAIEAIGTWPSDSDDIRVGYRADLLDIPRSLIPSFVLAESAPTLLNWFNQNLKIAQGVQTRWSESRRSGRNIWAASRVTMASACFDWLPGIRLLLGFYVSIFAATHDVSVGVSIAAICLTCQTYIVYRSYAFVCKVTNTPLTKHALASAFIGTLIWPPLRTTAAVAKLILPASKLAKVFGSATPKDVNAK